jgi:hypothetical protein
MFITIRELRKFIRESNDNVISLATHPKFQRAPTPIYVGLAEGDPYESSMLLTKLFREIPERAIKNPTPQDEIVLESLIDAVYPALSGLLSDEETRNEDYSRIDTLIREAKFTLGKVLKQCADEARAKGTCFNMEVTPDMNLALQTMYKTLMAY